MNEKLVQQIISLSKVFASPKRILLLELMSNGPVTYTMIREWFKELGINAPSSEIYHHVKILKSNGMVVWKKRKGYVITKKGLVAVERLKEIIKTKPKMPKIRMEF